MPVTKREEVTKQGFCKILGRTLLRGSLLLVLIQFQFQFSVIQIQSLSLKWVGWGWALI